MRPVFILALGLAIAGIEIQAHHSIAGVYDRSKQLTIEGIVTEFQFVNPHPFVFADVADRSGQTQSWRLELDNRFELVAVGMTADTFKRGDRIVASGSASRERPRALYTLRLDRPTDGLRYEQVGSSPLLRVK